MSIQERLQNLTDYVKPILGEYMDRLLLIGFVMVKLRQVGLGECYASFNRN